MRNSNVHVSLVRHEDSDATIDEEDLDSEKNFNLEVKSIVQKKAQLHERVMRANKKPSI